MGDNIRSVELARRAITGEKTGFVIGFIHGDDRIAMGGELEIVRYEPMGYGMLVVMKGKNGELSVEDVVALRQADMVAQEAGKDIATITDGRSNMRFLNQYPERFLIFRADPNVGQLKEPKRA